MPIPIEQIQVPGEVRTSSPGRQAFEILRAGFTLAPVVAGLDKFVHLLTTWEKYLAPPISRLFGDSVRTDQQLMMGVGAIEIIAGVIVALRPRMGAYIVGAWLLVIIGDLLLLGGALDIALRDFGLFLGALALGRLAAVYDVRVATRRFGRPVLAGA